MAVGFSAFYARKVCNEMIAGIAPPPHYSTRFVLYPGDYITNATELGFKPGWVVTYAPRSREYGTAFFVSFFGKMLTRGTPDIVNQQHKQEDMTLEKFREGFAQLDAVVHEGSNFSVVEAALGKPHSVFTNEDGSLAVFYDFEPRSSRPLHWHWLTNGFSLLVSNGIVMRKGYSYSSSE